MQKCNQHSLVHILKLKKTKTFLTYSFDLYLFISCYYKCRHLYSEFVSQLPVTVTKYLKERKTSLFERFHSNFWSHSKPTLYGQSRFQRCLPYGSQEERKKKERNTRGRRSQSIVSMSLSSHWFVSNNPTPLPLGPTS